MIGFMKKKKIKEKEERKTGKIILKSVLLVGTMVVFYKVPMLLAEKWTYSKLKKKNIEQHLEED